MTQRYTKTAVSARLDSMPVVSPDTASGQRISITASAVSSGTLTGGMYFVCPSKACFIAFGTAPVATNGATNFPFFGPANVPFLIAEGDKVSVIRDSEDGYLWLVPCTTEG